LSLRRHLSLRGRCGLEGRVTLRNRLSRYNRQSEAGGMCITMVQAKPGQVSNGRIALRRVWDAAHPRLREGD
jgi:hypothetical protein